MPKKTRTFADQPDLSTTAPIAATPSISLIPLKDRYALPTALAAVYCGYTEGTLRVRRSRGEGPPFVKDGSKVLYLVTDLEEYLSNLKRVGGH